MKAIREALTPTLTLILGALLMGSCMIKNSGHFHVGKKMQNMDIEAEKIEEIDADEGSQDVKGPQEEKT